MAGLQDWIVEVARERWATRTGLGAVLVVVGATLIAFFAQLNLSDVASREWAMTAIILVGVVALWWRTRLPHVARGKVGFGLAIEFEDEAHGKQIRNDFVATLKELIAGSPLSHKFEFVELPQSVARRLDRSAEVDRVSRQSNLAFLMWGRARLRNFPTGQSHVIDLTCQVRHAPMPVETSKAFEADFVASVPRRLVLRAEEGDMLTCEVAARHFDAAARYIIGTAAALSNDFAYAEQLLLDAEQRLQQSVDRREGAPAAVLLDRTKKRIGELYEEWLNRLMQQHIVKRDPLLLAEQDAVLAKLRRYRPDSVNVRMCAALIAFSLRHDVDAAKREIAACADSPDAGWRYSEAFLYAYEGDLQGAYRSYRRAFASPLENETVPTQCEEFIQSVLEEEPDRPWLFFAVGLINYRGKHDLIAARADFQSFIDQVDHARFRAQVDAPRKWIIEIDAVLTGGEPSVTLA